MDFYVVGLTKKILLFFEVALFVVRLTKNRNKWYHGFYDVLQFLRERVYKQEMVCSTCSFTKKDPEEPLKFIFPEGVINFHILK